MENRAWPDAVDAMVRGHDSVIRRGPARWTVGSVTVVRLDEPDRGPADLAGLLGRIRQVAPFAVPEVRGIDGPWLVTERPSGIPADEPERHPQPAVLAGLVGEGLAAMHRLPPSLLAPTAGQGQPGTGPMPTDAPDPGQDLVERCRRAVEAGLVDPAALPRPYDRYRPERLLELLIEGRPVEANPAHAQPPVLCHGHPVLDRCLVDRSHFGGFDGLESAVVADRHLDLAVAHLGVATTMGAEAVPSLYDGYGAEPDLILLDHHILAAHLLSLGAAPGAPIP